MSITINHAFVSAIADDPVQAAAGAVVPSNWNANLVITGMTATRVLYSDGTNLVDSANLTFDGTTLSTVGLSAARGTVTVSTPFTFTETMNAAGVSFTGALLKFTEGASGTAAGTLLIDLQYGTAAAEVSKFKVNKFGYVTAVGDLSAGAAQSINFFGRTSLDAVSGDGILRISNNAQTDFGRLQFGGTTSSFPSIKRSTTDLQARLADDSAYTNVDALAYKVSGTDIVSATQTLTNKRVTKRVSTITFNATPTYNTDNFDQGEITVTAAITNMTTNKSGTPVNGDSLLFAFLDSGGPWAITWGTGFTAGDSALPTTTTAGKVLMVSLRYTTLNSINKWVCTGSVANVA